MASIRHLTLVSLVAMSLPLVSALAAETGVWSLDTSKLGLVELQRLESHPGVLDFAEMGNTLLVVAETAAQPPFSGLPVTAARLEGRTGLQGLTVLLSKYGGALQFIDGNASVVAHEGRYFIVEATAPGLNRIRAEEDHNFATVPLAGRQVLFRSAAHLAAVAPADPSLKPLVDRIDRERYTANLKRLIDFKTRYSYSPNIQQVAKWGMESFKALGLEARIDTYGSRKSPNVVAELKGSTRPDDLVVVGGHMDSIAYDNDTNAPGADDNASGSAGVLELAHVLADTHPEATIRFVLFSGEEQGLYGSKAYVEVLKKNGELGKVKAMLNLDMIAFDKSGPLQVMLEGKAISHDFSDRLQAHAAAFAPDLEVNRTDNAWGSDHIPFLDRNIPATLTIEFEYDDNGQEHSPRDVFEICNLDLAIDILRMDAGALCELAGVKP